MDIEEQPEPGKRINRPSARLLNKRLASEIGRAALLTGEATAAYAIDGHAPLAVARPSTSAALAATLEVAAELDAAVAPWGGGTQMALGYSLSRLDLVVSLERMRQVTNLDSRDMTVTAEAGCSITELNAVLARSRQFVPLDGAFNNRASIGGRLATASAGLRRGMYGNARDFVMGLMIVRSDGTITHTGGSYVKNVTGYDLNKLFVGSLGTLGVIASATLRTFALPESEATVAAAFDDPSSIWAMLDDLAAAQIAPAALTVCGAGCLGAGRGFALEHADQVQPAAHPMLLVRLADATHAVRRQALAVRGFAMKYGARNVLMLRGEAMLPLWDALNDLPETMQILPNEAVVKVAVLPSEIGKLVEVARSFCAEHELRLCWMADANTGLVWLRVIGDGANDTAATFGASFRVFQETLARRWRNAIVLGCDPAIKQALPLWGADPQGLELMRAIKGRFDPSGILNPGRFVGGI